MLDALKEMIGAFDNVEIASKLMAYCLTTLAITVLEKKFFDNKQEFQLLTSKAKKWIKTAFKEIAEDPDFQKEIEENADLEDLSETIENYGEFIK